MTPTDMKNWPATMSRIVATLHTFQNGLLELTPPPINDLNWMLLETETHVSSYKTENLIVIAWWGSPTSP